MRCHMIFVGVALVVSMVGQTFAQRTGGGSATGQGAFNVGSATGGQGSAGNFGSGTTGQLDTSARYMRENRQGAFVGADSSDTDFVGRAEAGTNRGGGSGRSIRRGGGGRTNVNQNRGRGRQTDQVRITLQLGFAPPKPAAITPERAPGALSARIAGRMERSSWIKNLSPMDVSIEEGTATLRGIVATAHDRDLAERLVLLEGGIWKVENQLQVQSAPPELDGAPGLLEPPAVPSSE